MNRTYKVCNNDFFFLIFASSKKILHHAWVAMETDFVNRKRRKKTLLLSRVTPTEINICANNDMLKLKITFIVKFWGFSCSPGKIRIGITSSTGILVWYWLAFLNYMFTIIQFSEEKKL